MLKFTKYSKIRYDGELVGNGKETGEVRNITLDYEFNTWMLWDPFIDWGIISIPVDLINGSYNRLSKRNYYVEFDED